MWAVGLGTFLLACIAPIAALFALEAVGINGIPFDAFPIVMHFVASAPLVCQTAYAARTWQNSDHQSP